jgi:hypothetical protein
MGSSGTPWVSPVTFADHGITPKQPDPPCRDGSSRGRSNGQSRRAPRSLAGGRTNRPRVPCVSTSRRTADAVGHWPGHVGVAQSCNTDRFGFGDATGHLRRADRARADHAAPSRRAKRLEPGTPSSFTPVGEPGDHPGHHASGSAPSRACRAPYASGRAWPITPAITPAPTRPTRVRLRLSVTRAGRRSATSADHRPGQRRGDYAAPRRRPGGST